MGHARALLTLDDEEEQKAARDEIVKGHLSVREAEALVKKKKAKTVPKTRPVEDADERDLLERIQRHFGAKVALRRSGRGGKLEISFSDQKDLARIVDIFNL